MSAYTEGEWIEYRHPRGWVSDGKILETRPDGYFVVGSHDKDPEPSIVDPEDVVGYVGD